MYIAMMFQHMFVWILEAHVVQDILKRATESLGYSIYIEYTVYSNLYYFKNSEKMILLPKRSVSHL